MKNNFKFIASSLLFVLVSITASAQDATKNTSNGDAWLYWTTAAVLAVIFFFLTVVLYSANSVIRKETGRAFTFKSWWSSLDKALFTKAVPVEQEADVLLDHDYDGIKELDNALPPWWKYGFYITILVAGLYLLRFHVWKTGPDPQQEYDQEMRMAAAQIEEYRQKAGDMIDEKTVTMADAAGIAEGKKVFQENCVSCHGVNGEGKIGPNLTDSYWLHGGTINDVFKTIKYGVPEKSMPTWSKIFPASKIKDLASYVKSIAGTNPANAKAPDGELFQEGTTQNSAAKKDSVIGGKK